eukprot:g2692.t1
MRWGVSGTPITRGLADLRGLMRFLAPPGSALASPRWWATAVLQPLATAAAGAAGNSGGAGVAGVADGADGAGSAAGRRARATLARIARALIWRSRFATIARALSLPRQLPARPLAVRVLASSLLEVELYAPKHALFVQQARERLRCYQGDATPVSTAELRALLSGKRSPITALLRGADHVGLGSGSSTGTGTVAARMLQQCAGGRMLQVLFGRSRERCSAALRDTVVALATGYSSRAPDTPLPPLLRALELVVAGARCGVVCHPLTAMRVAMVARATARRALLPTTATVTPAASSSSAAAVAAAAPQHEAWWRQQRGTARRVLFGQRHALLLGLRRACLPARALRLVVSFTADLAADAFSERLRRHAQLALQRVRRARWALEEERGQAAVRLIGELERACPQVDAARGAQSTAFAQGTDPDGADALPRWLRQAGLVVAPARWSAARASLAGHMSAAAQACLLEQNRGLLGEARRKPSKRAAALSAAVEFVGNVRPQDVRGKAAADEHALWACVHGELERQAHGWDRSPRLGQVWCCGRCGFANELALDGVQPCSACDMRNVRARGPAGLNARRDDAADQAAAIVQAEDPPGSAAAAALAAALAYNNIHRTPQEAADNSMIYRHVEVAMATSLLETPLLGAAVPPAATPPLAPAAAAVAVAAGASTPALAPGNAHGTEQAPIIIVPEEVPSSARVNLVLVSRLVSEVMVKALVARARVRAALLPLLREVAARGHAALPEAMLASHRRCSNCSGGGLRWRATAYHRRTQNTAHISTSSATLRTCCWLCRLRALCDQWHSLLHVRGNRASPPLFFRFLRVLAPAAHAAAQAVRVECQAAQVACEALCRLVSELEEAYTFRLDGDESGRGRRHARGSSGGTRGRASGRGRGRGRGRSRGRGRGRGRGHAAGGAAAAEEEEEEEEEEEGAEAGESSGEAENGGAAALELQRVLLKRRQLVVVARARRQLGHDTSGAVRAELAALELEVDTQALLSHLGAGAGAGAGALVPPTPATTSSELGCSVCGRAIDLRVKVLQCAHLVCAACQCPPAAAAARCPRCACALPHALAAAPFITDVDPQLLAPGAGIGPGSDPKAGFQSGFGTKIDAIVHDVIQSLRADNDAMATATGAGAGGGAGGGGGGGRSAGEAVVRRTARPRKCIVFSQFADVLKLIGAALAANSVRFVRLQHHGAASARETVANFKADADVPVLLLPLKSGNHGLSLSEAQRVFLVEPSLIPALEAQATARVRRLDQTDTTFVHRYVTAGTVEQAISAFMAPRHRALEADFGAAPSGNSTAWAHPLTRDDLHSLFHDSCMICASRST